jgi:hypothetical protein
MTIWRSQGQTARAFTVDVGRSLYRESYGVLPALRRVFARRASPVAIGFLVDAFWIGSLQCDFPSHQLCL